MSFTLEHQRVTQLWIDSALPGLRHHRGPGSAELLQDLPSTGGSSQVKISKVVNGVETVLKTAAVINPSLYSAFTVSATASGTTLTVSSGAGQASVTDSTFSTGKIGFFIRFTGSTTPVYIADDFYSTVQ
jgi:hypothetical protein